jgi:protease-4
MIDFLVRLLKGLLLIFLIINFAPIVVRTVKKGIRTLEPGASVAVLNFQGPIKDAGWYCRTSKKLFEDPAVKALLLRINCDGGQPGTAQLIHNELKLLKTAHPKPVIALIESACLGNGYYVACAADTIIAPPAALIGGIGLVLSTPSDTSDKKPAVALLTSLAQAEKNDGSSTHRLGLTQEQVGEATRQALHDQLIQHIMTTRPSLMPSQATQWSKGQIVTGKQALDLGLIDKLGGFISAEELIREQAGITTRINWIKPNRPSSLQTALHPDDDGAFADEVTAFELLLV